MVKGIVGAAWRRHLPLAIGDDSGGGRRTSGRWPWGGDRWATVRLVPALDEV
jgi:hypothetical protein